MKEMLLTQRAMESILKLIEEEKMQSKDINIEIDLSNKRNDEWLEKFAKDLKERLKQL